MNCMKYKKQQFIGRILSYILAFCMIFIMIPITIYAQSLGQDAISIEATCQGATMEVYFNGERIQTESDTIMGIGKGYNNGDKKTRLKLLCLLAMKISEVLLLIIKKCLSQKKKVTK